MAPHSSEPLCYTTRSAAETRRLARRLARGLQPGDLLCLRGELGAGKTTFVQGLVKGLGASGPATSPSFVLVHQHRGHLPLYHLDLYRVSGADLTEIGVDDLIGADAVVVVEWAERLPPRLCADALQIEFEFVSGNNKARKIVIQGHGARGRQVVEDLAAYASSRA